MCVGFRYTVKDILPEGSLLVMASKVGVRLAYTGVNLSFLKWVCMRVGRVTWLQLDPNRVSAKPVRT